MLFALRELTGQDAGSSTQAWRELFPKAEVDVEVMALRAELKEKDRVKRALVLAGWGSRRGDILTAAVARIIPELDPELQEKVRDVLLGRLQRFDVDPLRKQLLDDDDQEMHREAIVAAGRMKTAALVPDLIELLQDANSVDGQLIEEALRGLTGERHEGAVAWKAWWDKLLMK